jgi:CRISPR system Cascade subunit CasD
MNSGASGHNTVFLRLEGPLQAWGDTSKFVIRRSMEAPTKSGVLGLICCAMGWSRQKVVEDPIPDKALHELVQCLIVRHDKEKDKPRQTLLDLLNTMTMGVRVDRPGTRWWDYHTVGAGIGMTTAAGGLKTGAQGTLIKRLEYLADASFLVALQGDSVLIETVAQALRSPKWPLYLGRKSCPPSVPVFTQPRKDKGKTWANPMAVDGDVKAALQALPWCPRYKNDPSPDLLDRLIEWRKVNDNDTAPVEAELWYDAPFSFDPPVHHPRLVVRDSVTVKVGDVLQHRTPSRPRPRADYSDGEYRKRRAERLRSDHGLCVFCKSPATTVQHVTYRHAGGDERLDELRSLCRLCHDAVTMIEYGLGMGLDRINPCDPRWRNNILRARGDIIRFRSEEGRRRALRPAPERVRRELLEENED